MELQPREAELVSFVIGESVRLLSKRFPGLGGADINGLKNQITAQLKAMKSDSDLRRSNPLLDKMKQTIGAGEAMNRKKPSQS